MKKKTMKRWRVVCVLGNGRKAGNCGHDHPSQMEAVRCDYEPRAYKRDIRAGLYIVAMEGRTP